MKALWPCTLLAIATSSPAWAQDRSAAPAPAAPSSPPASGGAPGSPAPAASAAPAGETGAAPAPGEAAPAPGQVPPGQAALFGPEPAGEGTAEALAPAAGEAAPSSAPAPAAPPPPPPESASPEPAPAEPTTAEPSKPASNNRGHLRLGARAGLVAPFGTVARGVAQLETAGMGAGYGLDLTFGVAEEVSLGAYGDLLVLDSPEGCNACAPLSYGAGLTVRYHLVQGLRLDPWASYGIGLIGLTGVEPNGEGAYQGLEWMRLTVGGDWYALPNLGFGPYMELGAGSYWTVPEGETASGVHFRFQMGMRIVVDFSGR